MNPPNQKEWRQLKEYHGLNWRIKTPEMFAEKMRSNMKAALYHADGWTSGPWVDIGQITSLHWVAFHGIFQWRGELRVDELHGPKEKFTDPAQIRSDLRTLNDESRKWFNSEDPNVLAREMAAYAATFHQIQPFIYGSDIVGRLILYRQADELFGKPLNLEDDLKVYHAALNSAVNGNLKPLAAQILENSNGRLEAEVTRIERDIEEAIRELGERERDLFKSH